MSSVAASATVRAFAAVILSLGAAAGAEAQQIVQVASFEHQVNGVGVSKDGRIFVSFPRWSEDAPVSVAELMKNGQLVPFPDDDWNSWRNSKADDVTPEDHFICVQAVVVDHHNNLWAVDAAAPDLGQEIPRGPKLVKIDLSSNKVAQVILLNQDVAPQGSYLNDIRFSPADDFAYVANSGTPGSLIAINLKSGEAKRFFDHHPSTQIEKGVTVVWHGRPLRRPNGRGVSSSVDGIALSMDGQTLYYHAVKGGTLYEVPTKDLQDADASDESIKSDIAKAGDDDPAEGLLIAKDGRMYIASPEDDSIKVRDPTPGGGFGKPRILVQDRRLVWPGSLAEGPDGTIYVTTSHIPESAWFRPDQGPQLPTQLWRIEMNPQKESNAAPSVRN
jgi:sugar lactone lactonase YvrE